MSDVQEIRLRNPVPVWAISDKDSEAFTSDTTTSISLGVDPGMRVIQHGVTGQDTTRIAEVNVVVTISTTEPMVPGTKIPLYRIAALFNGGMSVADIAEDFPSLTQQQIIDAYHYASANPPPLGNHYPTQSLKRLLRNSGFRRVETALKKRGNKLSK
jgi:uncharacterized protein (DUF433 family)